MLKRNAEWLPKLLPQNSIYNELFSNSNLILQESAFGIVDVQEFYNLNIYDVINGTLKNEDSGIWYQSEKKLTLPEILVIAKV